MRVPLARKPACERIYDLTSALDEASNREEMLTWFVVGAIILAALGRISLVSTLLIRRRIFTPAQELLLQAGR
ncbi:MAG TPA: hypothetical protein VFB28_01400 [Terriglobales bacterium]|nr:hypothetical protein [Terriglobales bacterium]